jgi:hypothetical protein
MPHKKLGSLALLLTAFAGTTVIAPLGVKADDAVRVNRAVGYLNDGVGTSEVRENCTWNERLVEYLVRDARGKVKVTDEDLDKIPGKTLKLVVVAMHTSGGAAFSGPKWIKIRGELRENGMVINNFEKSSHSAVDPFRWTGCSVLVKMSKQMGEYTAKWLERPQNIVDVEEDSDNLPPAAK